MKYEDIIHERSGIQEGVDRCYLLEKQSFKALEKFPSVCYNSPYNCILEINKKNRSDTIGQFEALKDIRAVKPDSEDKKYNKADIYSYWYDDFQMYLSIISSFKNLNDFNM